ncbi:MAG: hypothetical protein VXZ76_00240, partial [Bacteroidota bacterium]|nr:hypothetical protein [Bacteroidota bacterium]
LVILFSCNTQDFLISSTFQHWIGGRPETGSGTNYHFQCIAPANDSSFKILAIKAHHKVLNYSLKPKNYEKGDTLMVFANRSKEVWNSDTLCKIVYKLYDKDYTLVPKELKQLERLLYP